MRLGILASLVSARISVQRLTLNLVCDSRSGSWMVMGILQRYARNGKWHKSKGYGFELGRDEARPLSTKRSGTFPGSSPSSPDPVIPEAKFLHGLRIEEVTTIEDDRGVHRLAHTLKIDPLKFVPL